MPTRVYLMIAALVVLATGVITVRGAWSAQALETHEVFVAQTAREMIARGDYVVPMFGGELRLQKPPLMYWGAVGVATVGGEPDVPTWAARLPSALAAMALVGACIGIGTIVYDRRTGVLAGAMIGFSAGVFEFGANARPEMLYAACSGVAMLGFVGALRAQDRRVNLRWALLGWAAFGMAILAKGPHLPALMLIGLGAWWVRAIGWKAACRALRPVMGLCIAAALIVPWAIAIVMRVEDAPAFWANELFGARFADDGTGFAFGEWIVAVITPRYVWYLIVLLLPWGVLAPVAFFVPWQKNRPDLARGRDLFWAMVVPMVALSLATRARDYYLLPVLPMATVLMARGTIDVVEKAARVAWSRRAAVIALWGVAIGALAFAVGVEVASDLVQWEAVVLVSAFAIAGVCAIAVARAIPRTWAGAAFVGALASWAGAFGALGHQTVLGNERPEHIDDLATAAAEAAGESLEVISIGFDRDDLIYRVNRPITRLPRDSPASRLTPLAPAIIVATPKVLDRLSAEGLGIERGKVFIIEDTERYEVARIAPAQNE